MFVAASISAGMAVSAVASARLVPSCWSSGSRRSASRLEADDGARLGLGEVALGMGEGLEDGLLRFEGEAD